MRFIVTWGVPSEGFTHAAHFDDLEAARMFAEIIRDHCNVPVSLDEIGHGTFNPEDGLWSGTIWPVDLSRTRVEGRS